MRFIFQFIIFLTTINVSLAQTNWKSGYIISFQNDTTYGFISQQPSVKLSQECIFKPSNSTSEKKYQASEIKAFRFSDGKFFIARSHPEVKNGAAVFMEYIVKGRVNLFHYTGKLETRFFAEKDTNYIELKNSTQKIVSAEGTLKYIVSKKEFIGTLNYMMADGNMEKVLSNAKLNVNSLKRIVKQYHETTCPDQKCILYERKKKQIRIALEAYMGARYNQISLSNSKADYKVSPNIGVRILFKNPINWIERLNISADVSLQKLGKHTFRQKNSGTYSSIILDSKNHMLTEHSYMTYATKELEVDLKAIVIKVPLLLTYNLSSNSTQPYVGGGVSFVCIASQNNDFDYIPNTEYIDKSLPTLSWGGVVKVGCRTKVNNQNSIFMELLLEQSLSPWLEIRTLGLNLGYGF